MLIVWNCERCATKGDFRVPSVLDIADSVVNAHAAELMRKLGLKVYVAGISPPCALGDVINIRQSPVTAIFEVTHDAPASGL